MHRIIAKKNDADAMVEASNSLIEVTDDLRILLVKRLITSFGRQSKSFKMTLEDADNNECFDLIKNLHAKIDEEFLRDSISLANILADSQNAKNIPGGFFIVLDCKCQEKSVYVILKAEPHGAIGVNGLIVNVFKDIILSPAQKMYKAAVFQQVDEGLNAYNFDMYLFDDSFSFDSRLAKYFYRDFLGFSISENSKLQTKIFYDEFIAQIKRAYAEDLENQMRLTNLLEAEIESNVTINPNGIIRKIVPLDKRDEFISGILSRPGLEQSFIKDPTLIKSRLAKKSFKITEGLTLTGASIFFTDDKISVSSDPENKSVMIVKIKV